MSAKTSDSECNFMAYHNNTASIIPNGNREPDVQKKTTISICILLSQRLLLVRVFLRWFDGLIYSDTSRQIRSFSSKFRRKLASFSIYLASQFLLSSS